MTNVRDTSRDAYHGATHLEAQQQEIVTFLAKRCSRDWTRNEIAVATGMRISSVAGRVNKLVQLGVIAEGPRRPDRHTHIAAHALQLAPATSDLFTSA